ncbi:IES3 (YLR052W) [Zygosaccharomyces parabailii]|uniref:ZYBA0S15-00144g1_1 n=1 Tax=Zygosaccharomyces bailii (strain CLIB 213 / ATCC 58445 / CBS 680 / BCRC 21525 / NBRC 1098 / NCYC 1416 / NRRL Y-2227) TaxID=1333698 RepID=A0A8J2TB70_ZYGB2|nr:IES3 (YLR052W) [Zygosaccharomyces parabailii]CDF91858.1 ZYBA0S15-00144g1_1 [Zygosaccharomyces bailii CLIB 213]
MSTFQELLAQDEQIQYAANAVRHYHEERVPEFLEKDSHNRRTTPVSTPHASTSTTPASLTSTSSNTANMNAGNNKRHIVNVDDISRINYEMIKNTPGNLRDITLPQDPKTGNSDNEISTLKTKLYKNRLYDLNDDFLESISNRITPALQVQQRTETSLPLEDQISLLTQLQSNLIHDYHELLNTERKWFILKEIMLDANAELDLFSTQEERRTTVKLGATTVPPNANANSLVFNRPKRHKAQGGKPDNLL